MYEVKQSTGRPKRIYKRQFINTNVDYFNVFWMNNGKVELNEPNSSFVIFMNIFSYYFNVAFPLKDGSPRV
jgi:hypothetical protein